MLQTILRQKKIRYYTVLLFVLWSGVIIKAAIHALPLPQQVTDAFVKESPSVLSKEEYLGRLTLSEKEKLTAVLLKDMQAKVIKGIKTEELFTVYAYSPLIKAYIVSEGKKINLNIVCFYNEEVEKTYLIAATPIYNQDY